MFSKLSVMIEKKPLLKGLTRNTYLLAMTSFFSDVSTEMLYPVLPIFITQVLGADASVVGIVEGIAEGTQYTIQGFSGYIADRFGKRKGIALIGYALTALSKPLIGSATIWPQVATGRFSDRLGAGIRAAPRDSLIASSADEAHRGKAFGLESAGDNAGAVAGPLIAILLLYWFHVPMRTLFFLAFIPGAIAFLLVFSVKEKVIAKKNVLKFKLKSLPKRYWQYVGVIALFGIGNSSNAFLILRAKQSGIPIWETILIYAGFNLTAALASYPAGNLSDKFGRKNILLAAFVIFAIVYAGFSQSSNIIFLAILFLLYGLYQGIFRAVGKAFAADLSPLDFRATGIGIYSTVYGVTTLFASIVAGQIWTRISPSTAFAYGAVTAIAASFALIFIVKSKYR
jgi:MFS family permease